MDCITVVTAYGRKRHIALGDAGEFVWGKRPIPHRVVVSQFDINASVVEIPLPPKNGYARSRAGKVTYTVTVDSVEYRLLGYHWDNDAMQVCAAYVIDNKPVQSFMKLKRKQ